MMTAGAMVEEVLPFFRLKWFCKPLEDQRAMGPDAPEPDVVYIMDDECARDSDSLTV
jgi:hypothetical protein